MKAEQVEIAIDTLRVIAYKSAEAYGILLTAGMEKEAGHFGKMERQCVKSMNRLKSALAKAQRKGAKP